MKLIQAIFAVLVIILGMLVWLMLIPEPPGVGGTAHAVFPGMNIGGDGLARLGGQGPLIYALQMLTLLLTYLLVALGISEQRRSVMFWSLLMLACAVSMAIWSAIYLTYFSYLESAEIAIALGFPLPTTLMLFGIFPGGGLLCLLYIIGFRRFIYTEEDEVAYEALRARAEIPRAGEGSSQGKGSSQGEEG